MTGYKKINKYRNRKGYRVNEELLFIPEERAVAIKRTSLTDIETTPNIVRKFKGGFVTYNVMVFYLETLERILSFAYDRNIHFKNSLKSEGNND